MAQNNYRICTRCVMDTTDSDIHFDASGVCNHCNKFDAITSKNWYPNEFGGQELTRIFNELKEEGKGKDYDCIIGLSGGVDSSYLALVLKDYGLRPLVVHVDAGWNSELAVYNIEKIVKHCGYDLHTHVMDWKEIKDLQLAYLKAGVANQDVVQDHAFFSSLYHYAVKNGIKYVISGGNIATESVFPDSWHHSAMDSRNLNAIHRKFGKLKLKNYKTISFFEYYIQYPFLKGMKVVRPLNFMKYNKAEALEVLKNDVGYKDYGRKHGESRFTKFFQNYYLPQKFGMDKRRPHLSSQILSLELSRDQALEILNKPLYDPVELREDKLYISKKLGLTLDELETLINCPGHNYNEYPNWDRQYNLMRSVKSFINKVLGRNVSSYS